MSNFKYKLSIAAIMKYEEDYVLEWVSYHSLIGVNHFYIYDNDENSNMEKILKYFIDQDIVTLIKMPGQLKMFPAYNHCIKNYQNESEYIAFIDADEFINTYQYPWLSDTVDELFKKFQDGDHIWFGKKVGGIGINWKVFGTSNHKTKSEGLVIKNYLYHGTTEMNDHIKTIVNPRTVLTFDNPHYPVYKDGYVAVSQKGSVIYGPYFPDKSYTPLTIFHYFYKSEEEFMARMKKKKADVNISDYMMKQYLDEKMKEAELNNLQMNTSMEPYFDGTEQMVKKAMEYVM